MARAFWAPGRVNLIGEYTDLVGGLVLPVALDLGIRLDVVAAGETALVSADVDDPEWRRYVDAVEEELAALGRPAVGIAGELHSTLPIGSGLSSSAALEIVLALALCAVAEFELEPLELAQAARRAEHRAVGVPCGIMDQAVCVLGHAGCALLLDTGTLEHELVPLPPDTRIVVVDSGVRRTLERSGYADRQRELAEREPSRIRHVESENERVREAAAALRANDRRRLGELFHAGHESLRVDFEVTIPELDRLVALAVDNGAFAARMTGGGFGGSIVALVDAADSASFARAMIAHGRTWVCRASDGAREL